MTARPDREAVFLGVKSLASSSTMGGSSRCRRGFWRTDDSQAQTCDSDLRSLMSIDSVNELVRSQPIQA